MKRVHHIAAWFRVVGIALFIIILLSIDLKAALVQLWSFRLGWLALYCVCFFTSAVLKALRWRAALSAQGFVFPVWTVLGLNATASFLGSVTPGRLGELSKAAFLYRRSGSVPGSLVSVVLDRIYDIVMLLLFGIAAAVYFANVIFSEATGLILVLVLLAGVLVALYLWRRKLWNILRSMLRRALPVEHYNSATAAWDVFTQEMKRVFRLSRKAMSLFSVASYAFYFIQIYAVAEGFGVSVSFIYISLCLALSALISLLPISIGGLGTREATFILLLKRISIPPETATLIAFIDGTVLSLFLSGVFALALWRTTHTDEETQGESGGETLPS
jgi:hypothetical protein